MIAIIGNPNVGKTTFLYKLRDLGYSVFETDAWVTEQYKEGTEVFNMMKDEFGIQVVKDNCIDKNELKRLISEDFKVLRKIEHIVHTFLYSHLSQNIFDFVEIPIMKWSPVDFTLLFDKVINIVNNPHTSNFDNVDNFTDTLIDTNKRGFRELGTVDIYAKNVKNPEKLLKKIGIFPLSNL